MREDYSPGFQVTVDGQIMGTPHYMSPAQVRGKIEQIDFLSDIWSIGVILYECACLVLPFVGKQLEHVLQKIVQAEPINPVTANPRRRVPLELAEIIITCLKKDKNERLNGKGRSHLLPDRYDHYRFDDNCRGLQRTDLCSGMTLPGPDRKD